MAAGGPAPPLLVRFGFSNLAYVILRNLYFTSRLKIICFHAIQFVK